jgi:hypothetical protein
MHDRAQVPCALSGATSSIELFLGPELAAAAASNSCCGRSCGGPSGSISGSIGISSGIRSSRRPQRPLPTSAPATSDATAAAASASAVPPAAAASAAAHSGSSFHHARLQPQRPRRQRTQHLRKPAWRPRRQLQLQWHQWRPSNRRGRPPLAAQLSQACRSLFGFEPLGRNPRVYYVGSLYIERKRER